MQEVQGAVDVVVADLSFISLRTVLPALLGVCTPGAHLVLLVKPQFEAGRAEAARGKGVITDPDIWARVVDEVRAALAGAGAAMMEAMVSPLRGADGNVEFFVHARVPGETTGTDTAAANPARRATDGAAGGPPAPQGAGPQPRPKRAGP